MRIAVWSVVVCVMTWGLSVRGGEAGSLSQGRVVRGLEGSVEIGRGSTIQGLAPVWRDWLNGGADGREEARRDVRHEAPGIDVSGLDVPALERPAFGASALDASVREPAREQAREMTTEFEPAWRQEAAQEAPADKPAEKASRKGAGGRSSGTAAKGATGTPVNINTSSAEQLEALPGIGPSLAGRIVEYREKHGPFKRLEDLMNVQGVGEKSFQKLKPHINIGAAKAER